MAKKSFNRFLLIVLCYFMVSSVFFIDKVAAEGEEVTFSMLPQMSNAELFKCWDPLLKYLEKETGVRFTQVFPKNFDEHIKLCREGKIDFAYSNPFCYLQMTPQPGENPRGHKVMAIAVEPGGATFYGEFITRVDNMNIKKFEDIKGKNGWIVGYESSGGYLFEKGYALDHGIDLPKDCFLTESPGNKQDKVVMAVYNRETEFGCIRDGIREMMKDRIDLDQIRVLAETERYPGWVFSASVGVNPQIVEKIKKALSKIPPELFSEAALPGGVVRFQEATEKDIDPIRKLAGKVKMEY